MADKVSLINRLLYAFYSMRRQKAAMGRLAMVSTWLLIIVLISLFNHLVSRYP